MSMANSTPVVPPGVKDTDPTALTREMILHEITMMREIFEARLDAMDKALAKVEQYPTEVDRAVAKIKDLFDERFRSVGIQFEASGTALAAALATSKEAATKVESYFTKQFDAIGALIEAGKNATAGQISDIKDRLTVIESVKKGASENWAAILGGFGAIVGLVAIIGFVLTLTVKG